MIGAVVWLIQEVLVLLRDNIMPKALSRGLLLKVEQPSPYADVVSVVNKESAEK